jgi:RNA polymerase sigma-70 factor (ECF subfamily)
VTEPDAVLVARARRGAAGAFEVLLRRYFRVSYVVAMAQLDEHAEAEDACQEAFVRGWERLEQCRDGGRFGAWLLQIVRNTASNRRVYLRVRWTEELSATSAATDDGSPMKELERRELGRALRSALALLGDTAREVVLLHDLEGFRHKEIAERLEISEDMSRRHLSDARKHLRDILGTNAIVENTHD